MTRVIRKAGKQSYFAQGEWTSEFERAQKFGDVLSVVQACNEHQLEGVEIVLMIEESPSTYDVVMPWPRSGAGAG